MDYLEPMTAAVRAAANIYRSAKNDLHIEVKGEDKNNLVTAYDKQIQDFLYKKLSAAFPGCAFLGEEGGGKIEVPMGLCFIIDPIDGTTNFIRNFEHSAISVGLAFSPEHGTTFMELYRHADTALYQVKQGGRNGFSVYEKAN
ncbi:MAG: hypothetical protein BHV98_03410 [Clostridium sp. CAG:217_53_7]|nr:MAG: hypothetical protein BHV98_03410 [Clostridium sp. CAG:217_53_7]